jgi:signal transduction histidine kinase
MLNRLARHQLALLALAWLAAISIVAWLLYAARAQALERAERATAVLATAMEQQTVRAFQSVDVTLAAIADAHELHHPRRNDPDFQRLMQRRLRDLPFIRALFIVGADGWIIHDTDYPRTPRVSLADRDYFRGHRADPGLEAAIWHPVESRSGTGWFIPVTRRLARGARFPGIVVAAIQADHFSSQYEVLTGDAMALFFEDGTLVATTAANAGPVGQSFAGLPLFSRVAREPRGTYWTDRDLNGEPAAVSYRVVKDLPFVVHVSRSRRAALAEWRRSATGAAIAMTGLTLLVIWFTAYVVSQRRRRERERARRAQAEKMEALGQLTGGLAHDLRNLLNVVSTNLEVLAHPASGEALRAEGVQAMKRALHGGTQLIERLLSFARKRPAQTSRIDLAQWLAAARPLLQQAAGSTVELAVRCPPGLPAVQCDAPQLDSALVNLVANARDAGARRIEISAAPHEAQVRLTVRDDGPGMPEGVRRRALEPFFTTKGEEGTGLGLAQVYAFVRETGGDMAIDSAPGAGTAVHLFFPGA